MNKSKFLKKSLAMLLALMLVLAMIPLSASAAEGPAVTEVTVNGVTATGSDTSLTAAITEPTGDVNVTVEIENDAADVGYYGDATLKDTNEAKKVGEVWQFPLSDGDKEAKAFTFYVLDKESKQPVETYTVTFTTVAADDDATVKSVYLDNQYDCWNNIDTNKEIHYTVVAPYDLDLNTSKSYVEVTPNSATAKVYVGTSSKVADMDGDAYKVPVTAYDSRVEFTVKAENGNTMNYTVTVVRPIPFASFSIADERHESQISRVTEEPDWQVANTTEPIVEVYLPYGYEGTKFTPTFETNYDVKVVTDNGVELKSGETYDWTKLGATTNANGVGDVTIPINVKYSETLSEDWTLALDVRNDANDNNDEKDTIPAIKGVTVENYVAEIEGTTITVTLPQGVREESVDLKVNISDGTKVDVVDTTKTYTVTASKDGFVAVKGLTKGFFETDKYTLRVTAAIEEFDADAKAVQDYTLKIVTAKVEKPQLNSLVLKSEVTGEEKVGRIDHETGRVYFDGENAIPYRYKNVNAMVADEWQLFWSAPSGTTVTWNTTAAEGNMLPLSGTIVNRNMSYLPQNGRFDKTEAANYIVVANDTSSRAYKVVFTSAEASKNADLGKVQLAWNSVTKFDDLNTKNTTNAIVNNDNTITASIFYKDWQEYNKTGSGTNHGGATVVTTLPAGAELYFVATDGSLYAVDTLNEETPTISNRLAGVEAYSGQYLYGNTWNLRNKNHDKATDTLTLVVVSEALAEKVHGNQSEDTKGSIDTYTKLNTTANAGMFQKYELTLTQAEPRTGANLTSLSVYDNYTGTMIDGVLVGNTYTITLPAYFVDSNRKSVDELYLDFKPEQGGQTVKSVSKRETVVLNNLVWKADKTTLDTDDSVKLTWNPQYEAFTVKDANGKSGWFGHEDYDPQGRGREPWYQGQQLQGSHQDRRS